MRIAPSSAAGRDELQCNTAIRREHGAPPTIDPASPTVLTLKVLFCHQGLPIEEQGSRGQMELLSISYRDYEQKIREQLTEMFFRLTRSSSRPSWCSPPRPAQVIKQTFVY